MVTWVVDYLASTNRVGLRLIQQGEGFLRALQEVTETIHFSFFVEIFDQVLSISWRPTGSG